VASKAAFSGRPSWLFVSFFTPLPIIDLLVKM
jgi:hypothetical protein